MENITIAKIEEIKSSYAGYWPKRIYAQLAYAVKLSKVNEGKYDGTIKKAVEFLEKKQRADGYISKTAVLQAERLILGISIAAKKYTMICVAHAHIDMNWMWDYSETVAITIDTFRTMLNLMKEYPDFKFSQSQAAVYRIVEKYDLGMLNEIKERIKEGRWEVTASTWVEADKNMPNGESHARHILYTKKYLSELFELDPDSLSLDFEPDTFGHNQNIAEILVKGGVKYYYHCRGYDGHNLYRYKSPSGSSIIVYREPLWYNAVIDADIALHVPEFCLEYGIDSILKVYGVGDHGGGPTRRDIEKLIDMNTWPVFPTVKFGTYGEFFKKLDKIKSNIPVVEEELNFVFTGCFTTQTRIKSANRIGEAKMDEAEALSSLSTIFANGKYPGLRYERAWKKVLFNQFHDILPGSGVVETREYAMGQFQQVLAAANTGASTAIRNITSQIDTSFLIMEKEDIRKTVSEGAGTGYALDKFGLPQTERGRGKTRIFHIFNSSQYERYESIELAVWDWEGDEKRIEFKDGDGETIKHQIIENRNTQYWGHTHMKVLIEAKVPSYGYSTYVMSEKLPEEILVNWPRDPRVEKPDVFILENKHIKIVFDKINMNIVSLKEKMSDKEFIDGKRPAGVFRLIDEDDSKGMTAWVVGRYVKITKLDENIRVLSTNFDENSIRQWIEYEIDFRKSKLKVIISLEQNNTCLNYNIECNWMETSKKGGFIPQLNFHVPVGYECVKYRYDIPFGTIDRKELEMDVPANSWMTALPSEGNSGIMLISNSKYGFRGVKNSMALTLIRSSYDPDPYPENGIHKFKFAMDITDVSSKANLIRRAYEYNHPVCFVSATAHTGNLSLSKSFMSLKAENVIISAVKMSEFNNKEKRMIIRMYETAGINAKVVLEFEKKPKNAYFVDINEKICNDSETMVLSENKVEFTAKAFGVESICVEF